MQHCLVFMESGISNNAWGPADLVVGRFMKGPIIMLGAGVHPRAAAIAGRANESHVSAIAVRLAFTVPAHEPGQAKPLVTSVVADLFAEIARPFGWESLLWNGVLLHTRTSCGRSKRSRPIHDSSLNQHVLLVAY